MGTNGLFRRLDGENLAVFVEGHRVDADLTMDARAIASATEERIDVVIDDVPEILLRVFEDGVVGGAINLLFGTLLEDNGLLSHLDWTQWRFAGAISHMVVVGTRVIDRPEEIVDALAIEDDGSLDRSTIAAPRLLDIKAGHTRDGRGDEHVVDDALIAPIIGGLVFTAVAENGLDIFSTYGMLLALLVGCMLANTLIFNPLLAFVIMRRNPYPLLMRCLRESGLNAFFTRSSAANLPLNRDLCRRLGIDEDFYSVSIPLGATINMNGAAVTITVMTMAVANTLGIEVSWGAALMLCVVATLGACGTSGVAGGSLLLIPMTCALFGIGNDVAMQAVAVGFIIGVVQDSVETALNSSADVFFTATAERAKR